MDENRKSRIPLPDGVRRGSGLHALEIVFLSLIALIVLAAFVEAFSYKLVSSRTPFVIMVPMLLLIGFQASRLMRAGAMREVRFHVGAALRGRYAAFGKLTSLSASFAGFGLVIYTLGHYIGVGAFILVLMRGMAKERWGLSLIVAAATAAAIYVTFEYAFGVELYRGLFFRWLAGYRDF